MNLDGTFERSAAAGTGTRYAVWNSTGLLTIGAAVSSDERLKENIKPVSLGLNFINDLKPIEFNFINPDTPIDEGVNFGIVAQELESTLISHGITEKNGLVYIPNYEGDQEEYYSVNHVQLISPLIKAIQELSIKNNELESRILTLEEK